MSNVVMITGASGGIGAGTARAVAAAGSPVLLVDHRADGIERLAAELRADGRQALAYPADVTNEAAVQGAVAAVVEEWGSIHALVNCAATMISRSLTETTLEDWTRVLGVNATGTFLTCKHVVRALVAQDTGGVILNVSSISGRVGLPNQPAYCASKGAVLQLSRQIAADYARHDIRCNVVSPGSVRTEQLRSYLAAQADPAAAERVLVDAHPLRRIADVAEISAVIVFLLSPQASFITGADVPVDGGYTAV
ncbi:SDR family oxidoreductase [Dactylosporangium sp. NPDC000244]|uniref:SDR family NAD(P)-dependent oxidoreductase n=1 Tax=Dactylosporangium sp. NPDC000244 TaxID=3154365 RepID=UPI0033288699|nr:SDR family oxidoreductase [Dactylosporangium thailandense]